MFLAVIWIFWAIVSLCRSVMSLKFSLSQYEILIDIEKNNQSGQNKVYKEYLKLTLVPFSTTHKNSKNHITKDVSRRPKMYVTILIMLVFWEMITKVYKAQLISYISAISAYICHGDK